MKVILLKDIADLGKKYDTVEVADGYGMNYLLPEGKARAATDRAKAQIQEKKEQLEKKREQKREAVQSMLEEIDGEVVAIERTANENEQLFAGVSAEEIAGLFNDSLDVALETQHIQLDTPIKSLGEYSITIEASDETATVTLQIKEEE